MTNPLLRSLLNLWSRSAVLLATPSGTSDAGGNPLAAPVSTDNPLPVTVIGGGAGESGGGSVGGATETTLTQVLTEAGLIGGDTKEAATQLTLIKQLLNGGIVVRPPADIAIGFSTFTLEGTYSYQISDNLPAEARSYTVQAIGSDVRYIIQRFANDNPTPLIGMVLYEGERERIYTSSPARFASVSSSGCKLSVIWWG